MPKELSFDETVHMIINSVAEGLIDKHNAFEMISKAAKKNLEAKMKELQTSLNAALLTLERAVDEYIINEAVFPLDTMTLEDATKAFNNHGLVLECDNGHVKGVYQEKAAAAAL